MRKHKIPAFLLVLVATSGHAAHWSVDGANSTLTFTGEHAGEAFNGHFSTFKPVIDFDPAHPEQGQIDVTIDMASAIVEGKDRQESITTADWFAVKQFPTARFVSSSIRATGSDKAGLDTYLAKGMLTLRGISKEVGLQFWLKQSGNRAESRGTVTVNRADFGVGQGEWKSDAYMKFPVTVNFVIHASK